MTIAITRGDRELAAMDPTGDLWVYDIVKDPLRPAFIGSVCS
jgi:hypothetical protein